MVYLIIDTIRALSLVNSYSMLTKCSEKWVYICSTSFSRLFLVCLMPPVLAMIAGWSRICLLKYLFRHPIGMGSLWCLHRESLTQLRKLGIPRLAWCLFTIFSKQLRGSFMPACSIVYTTKLPKNPRNIRGLSWSE